MALPAALQALYDRLQGYNGDPYNATTNPLGIARGGNQNPIGNFLKLVKDYTAFGKGISDLTSSASADAIAAAQSAASALAERQAAQNAATNAYNSAQDAAAKVALAAAEADRAKAQADLAKAFATGLNMPAVTPDMAGRFLKVNADGTAYELGLITIATAAEINAGTGTGLANAATLGPILQGIRDGTTAVADKLPPIGSYVLRPSNAAALGPNWLEAKGQVVSIAAYPALADALPALNRQYLNSNPYLGDIISTYDVNNGGGIGRLNWSTLDSTGRFFATFSSGWMYRDAAKGISYTATPIFTGGGVSAASVRLRDNDLVFMPASGSFGAPQHIDLTSQATIQNGLVNSNVPGASASGYEALFRLPNKTLIAIATTGASPQTWGVYRLRVSETRTQWAKFNPAFLGSPNPQTPIRGWQIKNGTVFIACRLTPTDPVSIFRTTDGETWTACTLTGERGASLGLSAVASYDPECSINAFAAGDYNTQAEGKNGQHIVLRHATQAGLWYVSNDGGQTFRGILSTTFNFGSTTGQYLASGTTLGSISFFWDELRNRWWVGFHARKSNDPNGTSRIYGVIYQSTDLVTFSLVGEQFSGYNPGADPNDGVCFATNGKIVVGSAVAFRGYWTTRNISDGSTLMIEDFTSGAWAIAKDYPFDGFVIFGGTGNRGQSTTKYIRWMSKDETIDTGWLNAGYSTDQTIRYPQVAGNYVAAAVSDGSFDRTFFGTRFSYNPVTERKLPTLTQTALQGTVGQEIYEKYGDFDNNRALRWYLRAK